MPAGINLNINWDAGSGTYEMAVSSTDVSAIGIYDVRLVASFANACSNCVDDSSYEFQIMLDNADPCATLNCEINALVELDITKYTLPGDFVVITDF